MNSKFLKIVGVVICAMILGFVASSLLNKSPATSPNVTPTQNQPDASSMNSTTPSNSAADNSTSPAAGAGAGSTQASQTVGSSQQAESIVSAIYSKQIAKDPSLKVKYDHTAMVGGQRVYVVQVFGQVSGHATTIGWVDVREDGLVQNDLLRNGWVQPNQYQP